MTQINAYLHFNGNCREAMTFQIFSAGGEIGHPLKEEFWGGTFGDLTDKFGINWMFNFDKNQKA